MALLTYCFSFIICSCNFFVFFVVLSCVVIQISFSPSLFVVIINVLFLQAVEFSRLVSSLRPEEPEDVIVNACQKLIAFFNQRCEQKVVFVKQHGLLPLMELLEVPKPRVCNYSILVFFVTRTLHFTSSTRVGPLTLGHGYETWTLLFWFKILKVHLKQPSWTRGHVFGSDMGIRVRVIQLIFSSCLSFSFFFHLA